MRSYNSDESAVVTVSWDGNVEGLATFLVPSHSPSLCRPVEFRCSLVIMHVADTALQCICDYNPCMKKFVPAMKFNVINNQCLTT